MYHDVLMNGLSDETTERNINCNKYTVVFLLKHYLHSLSITNKVSMYLMEVIYVRMLAQTSSSSC